MNVYIGLDISTAKIGVAILSEKRKLLETKLIKLKKDTVLEDRTREMVAELMPLMVDRKVIDVFVEEPASIFSMGKSSAHTISKLQRFNGMCCYALSILFNRIPKLIPVRSARKSVGVKIKRGDNTKLEVIKWVKERYPKDFIFEYTRHGNPKPGTDDIADAIVVGLAGIDLKE